MNSRLWIFGGFSSKGVLNDLFNLNLKTLVWEKVKSNSNPPNPYQGMSLVGFDSSLYVLGGCNYKN